VSWNIDNAKVDLQRWFYCIYDRTNRGHRNCQQKQSQKKCAQAEPDLIHTSTIASRCIIIAGRFLENGKNGKNGEKPVINGQ